MALIVQKRSAFKNVIHINFATENWEFANVYATGRAQNAQNRDVLKIAPGTERASGKLENARVTSTGSVQTVGNRFARNHAKTEVCC